MPMVRRQLLRAVLLSPLLALPFPGRGQPRQQGGTGLIDLMPAFWRDYDATQTAPDRVAALHSRFFLPHAPEFAGAGLRPDAGRIAAWLPAFDAMAAQVRALHAGFGAHYARHVAHFHAAFPDFRRERAPIYLMPSLFAFDGHLQPWQGRLPCSSGRTASSATMARMRTCRSSSTTSPSTCTRPRSRRRW